MITRLYQVVEKIISLWAYLFEISPLSAFWMLLCLLFLGRVAWHLWHLGLPLHWKLSASSPYAAVIPHLLRSKDPSSSRDQKKATPEEVREEIRRLEDAFKSMKDQDQDQDQDQDSKR